MSNVRPCKFDWECTRPDCYFWHPNGRQIDFAPPGQKGGNGAFDGSEEIHYDATQWYPQASNCECCHGYMYSCGGPKCMTSAGPSQCVSCISVPQHAMAPHNPEHHPDTWFPQSRNCNCCKGYVYNCGNATCAALGTGECGCKYEQQFEADSAALASANEGNANTPPTSSF